MTLPASADGEYAPPAESAGGWRWRSGGDDNALPAAECRRQDALWNGYPWGLAVVHHGWLVCERYSFNVGAGTRFDVWSATKSVTALAWGVLLAREGAAAGVDLATPVYDLLDGIAPAAARADGHRRAITVGHLLSMTSGIPGERHGVFGVAVGTDTGAFEFAFGRAADRAGARTSPLAFEPGTDWDYSDPGFCHLSPALTAVAGCSLADYAQAALFDPIGIDPPGWDDQGGRGFVGPYTNAHSGLHLTARDLARIGYLALHAGRWAERPVVPADWIDRVGRPSQPFNPAYGLGWWTNRAGGYRPGLPTDVIAMAGFAGNRCWVVPSHDVVVARVGAGPAAWDDRDLLPAVLSALTAAR